LFVTLLGLASRILTRRLSPSPSLPGEIDLRVGLDASTTRDLSAAEGELAKTFFEFARKQLEDEQTIHIFVRRLIGGERFAKDMLPGGMRVQRTWFFNYQFFIEAHWQRRRLILASAELDGRYALNTVWFPDRGIAIAVIANGVDVSVFQRFLLRYLSGNPIQRRSSEAPSRIVFGFPHMLHMLWNGLPALRRFAQDGIPSQADVHYLFEPFGPLDALLPELSGRLKRMSLEEATRLNDSYQISLGVGGRFIDRETQARIRDFARLAASAGCMAERKRLANSFAPIFWITAKPGNRSLVNEPRVLAGLMRGLVERYPNSGFIIDGASKPWDFAWNRNYDGFFRKHIEGLVVESAELLAGITAKCSDILDRVLILNDLPVTEEIVFGELADFYVAHGGSMQHKIGWIHEKPGFVHSTSRFLRFFETLRHATEAMAPVYFPTPGLIADENVLERSSKAYARKDERYHITDVNRFVAEVASACETSRGTSSAASDSRNDIRAARN
jgi:hypothetical protein